MPNKDRDVEGDDTPTASAVHDDHPREKQRRSKSERKPREERERDREGRPHRSSKSTRSSKNSDGASDLSASKRHRRKDRDKEKERPSSMSDLFAGISNSGMDMSRISLPYPSFSKAHSKEALSREDVSSPTQKRSDPFTPEPTDVDGADGETERGDRGDDTRTSSSSKKSARPPTPPETDLADKRRTRELKDEDGLLRPRSRASGVSRSQSLRDDRSRVSRKSRTSSQATYVKAPPHRSADKLRTESRLSSSSQRSTRRSSSLRVSRRRHGDEVESSPSSAQDSSPKTPTQNTPFAPPVYTEGRPYSTSTTTTDTDDVSGLHSKTATPASHMGGMPPPPPPPPPALDLQDVPRVDYLLQNGGLAYPVPRNFLSVLPRQTLTKPNEQARAGTEVLFTPFFNLLEQYNTVLGKSGSIAVATGHRSVARRLLDRLENVFSRDLPENGCSCVMCDRSHEIHRGLTWGDVLEWVSGRIDLPQWPPFDLAEIGQKAAEVSAEEPARPASPVKLDPDIAEEFREHYLRQSKKVRSAVDKWLTKTGETPVPPPQEVDDETLTFAMLTSLGQDDRPFFNSILSGSRELRPATRAPTPLHRTTRTDFIIKCGLSLQRLYRLDQVPRDPETAMYLIKNPHTHDLLVTLSDINSSEWEILTSGRFDGFLWSGADANELDSRAGTPLNLPSRGPSAMGSRNTTPFSPYSRGTTPASFVSLASSGMPGTNGRAPVSNDEEMEMAAIAQIEREIYTGMEALEDAFEKLHHQAEVVRNALRQRGAGLMQNLQSRKRIDILSAPGSANSQDSKAERPAWAQGGDDGSDSEWGFDDGDIMPDDSASNISSSRHRRPKRRTERRTPAPIEEEEE